MYSHFVALDFALEKRIHERPVYCFFAEVISEYLLLFSHGALAFTVDGLHSGPTP